MVLLLITRSEAGENWFLQADEVSVTWKKYHPYSRHPAFYSDEQMNDALELTLNTDILGVFYWDNRVHAETSTAQYRHIGYETKLGIRVFSWLEAGWYHHSQHGLDAAYPSMKFPAEDAYSVKIMIFNQRPRGRTLTGF